MVFLPPCQNVRVCFLLPVLTRLFSDEYGTFDLILSISVFAGVLISLSLESALVRFWSSDDNRKQTAEKFMTCMITVLVVGSLVIAGSFVLARLPFFTFKSANDSRPSPNCDDRDSFSSAFQPQQRLLQDAQRDPQVQFDELGPYLLLLRFCPRFSSSTKLVA